MQIDTNVFGAPPTSSARRRAITRAAVALGVMAVATDSQSQTTQPEMKNAPAIPANLGRTTIHQEIDMQATAERIYTALIDAKRFAAFSTMPAEIDAKEGGAFSMFGGIIVGRNLELTPNQRIVQAWRSSHWPQGSYSIVKFDLRRTDLGTLIVLDHRGFPDGQYDNLFAGWNEHYWGPLAKFLG